MEIYKIVNDIKLSNIDPYFSGNKNSISTYGLGSYFTSNKTYVNEYIQANNFYIKLTYGMEDLSNSCTIGEDDLPDIDDVNYTDDKVWIKELLDFIPISELADTLNDKDYIFIENEKEIVIIPKGSRPSIPLVRCELHCLNNRLKEELQKTNINLNQINKNDFEILDLILDKYL